MNNYFIYLTGAIMGLTYEEQNEWRDNIAKAFKDQWCNSNFYNVQFINPIKYYNFKEKRHETEREVMNFDLHKVRNSNLVIVNFNSPKSLGTMVELAVAHENSIPIIGLNENSNELHPWQECMCERIFDNMEELLYYVTDYYLN